MKLPYTTPELLSTHFRIPSTQLQSYFILNISTSLVHGGALIPISSLLADSLVLVLLSYPRTRHPETPIPFYSLHSRSHFISGFRPRVPSLSYSSLSLHFTPLVPPHPYPARSHSPGGTYTYARNPDELSTQKLESANHPAAPLPLQNRHERLNGIHKNDSRDQVYSLDSTPWHDDHEAKASVLASVLESGRESSVVKRSVRIETLGGAINKCLPQSNASVMACPPCRRVLTPHTKHTTHSFPTPPASPALPKSAVTVTISESAVSCLLSLALCLGVP
ncbi:hypothetical protein KQX54_019115 [Cotesia glomerata]|uniref:Uncharacterized protein n=1 Tax=Cotesia glomerata TaxID=32391 RepID=A0AAV7IF92_COTGL|nr:hypothetical protein KQX54_019115 [Cotesia glomerata]